MNLQTIRADFPILSRKINGNPLVYFDNANTSQKPQSVIDAMTKYYSQENANIHRGVYQLSEEATAMYEGTRDEVQKFINAESREEIIFTHGATEGLNIVAQMMIENILEPGDTVVISETEHHANIVPWHITAKRQGTNLKYIPVNEKGELQTQDFASLLDSQTKVLSIQCASNVTGIIHPLKELIKQARDHGMLVVIDACQAAPHFPIDVQELDCDFLVFSTHKMMGATGLGVLYGKKKFLEKFEPVMGGGDMISVVGAQESSWAELPHKFEPGTPHIAGVAGLKAAMEYIQKIGFENIQALEDNLMFYAFEKLKEVKTLQVHTPIPSRVSGNELRVGNEGTSLKEQATRNTPHVTSGHLPIIPFSMVNAHPHDIATLLDLQGIAIRAGHHCAQILHNKWNMPATCRISMSFFNTKEEIDLCVNALLEVEKMFG